MWFFPSQLIGNHNTDMDAGEQDLPESSPNMSSAMKTVSTPLFPIPLACELLMCMVL